MNKWEKANGPVYVIYDEETGKVLRIVVNPTDEYWSSLQLTNIVRIPVPARVYHESLENQAFIHEKLFEYSHAEFLKKTGKAAYRRPERPQITEEEQRQINRQRLKELPDERVFELAEKLSFDQDIRAEAELRRSKKG